MAYLEGKVDEQSGGYGELRDAVQHVGGQIVALDQRVERFRDQLSGRIDGLGTRVDHLDERVDRFRQELGGRMDALDQKVDPSREELSGRIDALDQKVSRHFVWIVGIQITNLVTAVGVLAAALFRG